MNLSQIDINIIINEIKKNNNDKNLISYVEKFVNKDFITLLTSNKNIINNLPASIIKYYYSTIELEYKKVLSNCSIKDINLLSRLIKLCTNEDDIYNLSRDFMLNTQLRPELLYKKFPNFFAATVFLNYTPVPLDESLVFKVPNFPSEINTGFFLVQPITKKLMKKVLKYKDKASVERFFTTVNMCIERGTAKINNDALKYCIHPITLKNLLNNYNFSWREQVKIYNLAKHNNDLFITFIHTQNIPDFLLKRLIKNDFIHYYLASNPFCTDDFIIDLYKTNKDIDWLYVHTHINMSEHIKYAQYLSEHGDSSVIEYSLSLSEKNGQKIKNLKKLRNLSIDETIIENILAKKVSELEIGIHNELENNI